MSRPELPPSEELEASFPEDVFDRALEELRNVFFINLPEDRRDAFLPRVGEAERQLEELLMVWQRLRQDRLDQIEALRTRYELEDKLGLGSYTGGQFPEIDEAHRVERAADTALWLDYRSLFVFGDLLLADFVGMSELVWEAPEDVDHLNGPTRFVASCQHSASVQVDLKWT